MDWEVGTCFLMGLESGKHWKWTEKWSAKMGASFQIGNMYPLSPPPGPLRQTMPLVANSPPAEVSTRVIVIRKYLIQS